MSPHRRLQPVREYPRELSRSWESQEGYAENAGLCHVVLVLASTRSGHLFTAIHMSKEQSVDLQPVQRGSWCLPCLSPSKRTRSRIIGPQETNTLTQTQSCENNTNGLCCFLLVGCSPSKGQSRAIAPTQFSECTTPQSEGRRDFFPKKSKNNNNNNNNNK